MHANKFTMFVCLSIFIIVLLIYQVVDNTHNICKQKRERVKIFKRKQLINEKSRHISSIIVIFFFENKIKDLLGVCNVLIYFVIWISLVLKFSVIIGISNHLLFSKINFIIIVAVNYMIVWIVFDSAANVARSYSALVAFVLYSCYCSQCNQYLYFAHLTFCLPC